MSKLTKLFDVIDNCIEENKYEFTYIEEDENGKYMGSDTTITSDGLQELRYLLDDLYDEIGEKTMDKEFIDNPVEAYEKLKAENEMIINEYNKLQTEIIGDVEFKEIMLTGITPLKVLQNLKERNRELQAFYDVHESFKTDFDTNRKLLDKYRTTLQEIKDIAEYSIMHNEKLNSNYQIILQLITKAEEE